MASATPPSADAALSRWRNNLIDLSRRNPLVSLRPTRSSYLEVTQPGLADVFEHLVRQGKPWSFYLPPEAEDGAKKNSRKKEPPAPKASELVTTEPDRGRLLHVLTNLYRRYKTDYRERGLHILYLALGTLEWRDADDETIRSPLVLVPVDLRRHSLQEPFTLAAVEEEDVLLNPAVQARLLQDFDFRLPAAPAEWDEKTPGAYLDEVAAAVAGLPGWQVRPTVVLSLFSFYKGVIFQDLADNAERAKGHPVVQLLAGMTVALPKVERPDERELDQRQDPRQQFHILDADASQRLSLEAAARGESFVLIGPPGTGKSQTIANLIADHIAHGKRVLFVSDKMAALEVVFQRLRHVGLGDYCLELHSHKANKRGVITELARCLDERRRVTAAPGEDAFDRLRGRREQLNRYVQALHQVREPRRKSAWDALAELPRWQDLPLLPLGLPAQRRPGDDATKLVIGEFTAGHFDELKQLLQRLQQLWHVRSADFPWRGFKAERYTLQLRDEVVSLIDRVRNRGDKLRAAADQYGRQLGVPGSIAGLLKLGELLEKRPPLVAAAWLRSDDLPHLAEELEQCAKQYQALGRARLPLTELYGAALWQLPDGTAAKVEQAWRAAAALLAPADERGADFLKLQHRLHAWAAETQKRVPAWLTEVRALDKWLALPLPVGAGSEAKPAAGAEAKLDPSLEDLRHFVRLVNLCQTDHPAEKSWLHDPAALVKAQSLITAIRPAVHNHRRARQHLLQTYTEKFFELELPRMAEGFAGPYKSWLRFFNMQFRRDRRAIAKTARSEEYPATGPQDVLTGRDALADKTRIESEQSQHRGLLGRYEKGVDTDVDAADKAAKLAAEAVELAHALGHESLPPRLADALASGSPPEKVRAALRRLNESFAGWAHLTHEVQTLLPMGTLPGHNDPLEECALSALVHYARDLQAALNHFAAQTDTVLSKSAAPADMVALVADLKQAEELRAFEGRQQTDAPRWAARLGEGFRGLDTDWEGLRKALAWTRKVRECLGLLREGEAPAEPFGGLPPANPARQGGGDGPHHPRPDGRGSPSRAGSLPVPDEGFIQQALGTPPSARELRQALEQYEHALHGFEGHFDAPGPLLDRKPLREQGPDAVLAYLAKLRDRAGELADWVDWRHTAERFAHLGLQAFWDRAQEETVPRERVVDLFQKAFWGTWLDAVFQQDPVLSGFRRAEHERLLEEFRDLDRQLLRQGGARVAGRLGPVTRGDDDPEVVLLRKEAHKKTKHLALRDLFDAMPGLLQQLKPCLLMSPLSVSQFLPADPAKVRFDLVVFDEASQLLPEDAVGAIYRGGQLVVTGDNQQLPPTTFFQQSVEDGGPDDDEAPPLFESVLDACLGAGFPRQMLRWHYRSRHEHLIAFSNASFYEGKLVTFPAPCLADPTLGVSFRHVPDGVYDRGGRRDNPREAQEVARLALDHFRACPDQSLGVIAFSYAQMERIEDEIDRRLREHPDLERFFDDARLEGFFVKNLETVQGDERDVILLSVGYGKDEAGKVVLNFGPLNRDGGERRLNVAVTRARRRLVVVSSLRGRELDLGGSRAAGLAHLQRYLDFAERGIDALPADRAADVPLTGLHADVAAELKKHGFDAVPFVGCGVYRLDLGVVRPADPGRFILGVEFDGPAYAQASTARDRDRLRPEVLGRLGWRLHRIWAPDWLYRRQEELDRLLAATRAAT